MMNVSCTKMCNNISLGEMILLSNKPNSPVIVNGSNTITLMFDDVVTSLLLDKMRKIKMERSIEDVLYVIGQLVNKDKVK